MAMSQHPNIPSQVPKSGVPDGAGAHHADGDAALPHLHDADLIVGEGEAFEGGGPGRVKRYGILGDFGISQAKIWGDFTWFTIWLFNIAMENHHF